MKRLFIFGLPVQQKDIDRFWSKVDIRGDDECWEWQAGKNSSGSYNYGCFWINGSNCLTHRLAVTFHLGLDRLVSAEEIMHICDNPPCCNPHHLIQGTHLENMRDMNAKGRRQCQRGVDRPAAKLDDEKVRRIRTLHRRHLKYKKYNIAYLARMYGVDRTVIRLVITRMGWKHVKDNPNE